MEIATEKIKRIYNSENYKTPLDIDQQHELRGELLSALIELSKAQEADLLYQENLRELTKLIQELMTENHEKDLEIARLLNRYQFIRRPQGVNNVKK